MLSCSPVISFSSSVSFLSLFCLSLCFSLSLKENKGSFYLFLDIHRLVELNENYRYETRFEKENTVLHCVFVSKVNKETIPKPVKRKLEIIKLSKKKNRIGDQVKC